MPLHRPDVLRTLRREIDATSVAVIRDVPLSPRHFDGLSPRGGADLLFKRKEEGDAVIVLIEEAVRYTAQDPRLASSFASPPQSGWRPLVVVSPADLRIVLQHVDSLLGLDGKPPRLEKGDASPRTLVVRTEDVAREADGQSHGKDQDRFGSDLVEEARAGRLEAPLFREKEMAALVRIVSKAGKNAACLVGPPGVGKTAVVEGMAVAIATRQVPETIASARILDVNLSFLAAGATYQNEFEGRLKALLDRARHDPNTILFLDELHTIRRPGSDASQMIKSDLGRGRIRCIGATTNSEFRLIEADEALARRFQPVPVAELTPVQTHAILDAVRARFERHHGVSISPELLGDVVKLAVRYVPDRHLPDKALDLLDEACAASSVASAQHERDRLEAKGEGNQ
jgi:ATP-dependent Clp protease ATP-binding subunit ClpA